ncbi:transmembrane protein 131-like isoform X1 [Saccostrea echinata]|uniref:transmembrane protein 131-like isoform X1 n=1 Tax=Saccostrea echinata TaxID=191078 RepID=UPI002A82A0F4|nr:transmembrane protein 131-like isoform X1 [Saccostrea echinata]
MARVKCHDRRKMSVECLHFVLLIQSFTQCFLHTIAVESHSQAFVQTDNHLTYIGDGRDINGIPLEVNPGHTYSAENIIYKNSVRLDPPWLDFQERPVGMPFMEQVVVHNTDSRNDLHLLSISGSTVHFHCSFFQEKIVPPGGNTTFDVVFLAREEGNVENTLYIHTSVGSFSYNVFGVGIPNPYRLRPYLGAKVPLNSSFSPIIKIHNPFSSTLQVTEMFSSEGDLHLELPSGDLEAPRSLWEIPPYETKTVMKANFVGRVENNHTAFIRIKTNQEQTNNLVILPVEVEVSSVPGLYSPAEMIDFGIMRTLDDPVTVNLNLVNTGFKPIHISSVSVSPPNEAISIDFRPTKLQPDILRHTSVARITFNAEKALHRKQWSGKIIVKSRNGQQKITIPYKAAVLHGSLVYSVNNTYFFSARDIWNITRAITFTNTFNFSVVLYNISIPSQFHHFFSILNFTSPFMLKPRKTSTPFYLQFHPNETQLHFTTYITLHTNASTFTIPIIVYNGLLTVIPHRPEKFKGQFDFGTMGVEEKRSMIFTLRNDNPIDVHIGEITPDMNGTKVFFLGMERGNGTMLTQRHNITEVDYNFLKIKPYHYAVFRLNLTAPDHEGVFASDMLITTQFEDIWIPIAVRTADGSLIAIPESLHFDKMYPGMVDYRVLQIHSTFRDYMEVIGVTFQPPDSRFYYEPPSTERILLIPDKPNNVGKIYFDAKRECKDECYVGLATNTPAGHQWLLGLGLFRDVIETDQYLYTKLQQKWRTIQKSNLNTANVTIEMDTNEVRGFLYSAQAHLHWPSLVRKCHIRFPLTQIGNISISDFIVENPGDIPVLIQILPLPLYPNPQTIADLLYRNFRFSTDPGDTIEMDDLDIFTLPDLEQYNPSRQNPVPGFRKHIETSLGVKPHKLSITTILQPGVKVKVRVGFQPKDDISRTSIILIRNNLTIIDAIVVQGQGGRGEMKLSNKRPGSSIPLQFDITEKHLKNCDKKKQTKNTMVPNFTVRRSFTLKNTGELPFFIHSYSINGSPCEGYGFRVLDCEGYEMLPNTSRKIDIAFTPDFTMSRIRRILTIHSSLGPVANYTLQATIPPHTLSRCSAALPRPNWEPVLYYSITCVMAFLLFCILVAAYFEADRIFVADIIRRKIKFSSAAQTFDRNKIFDLRQVAGLTSTHTPNSPTRITQVSPLLTQNNNLTTKTAVNLSNGHVEHRSHKEAFGSTLLKVLKKLFASKSSRSNNNKKSKVEKGEPVKEEPAQSQQVPKVKSADERTSVNQESTEKSNMTQRNKNKKAARRQHSSELLTNQSDVYNSGPQEAKQNDTSLTYNRQNSQEHHDKMYKNSHKTSSTGLDDFNLVEDPKSDISDTKLKNRKKNKSRPEIIPRYMTQASVDDETSSTSTESSVGDVEEKSSSARDSTPEPQHHPKPKKSKPRVVKTTGHYDKTADDAEFELTSKSKGHKRIKGKSKDVYGGDIFHPDSLELPYDMEKLEKKEKSKKKALKLQNLKGDSESSDSRGSLDEPMPNWDMPVNSPDEDLSELAQQTARFAQKHGKNMTPNGTTPDILSSSSRSSSYSDIVSSTENGKYKEPRRINTFPGLEPNIPAAIGTKARAAPVGSGKGRNVWNATPPTTPDSVLGSFGLQTIQETNRLPSTENILPTSLPDTPRVEPEVPADPFAPAGGPFSGNFMNYPSSPGYDAPQTMMQKLQQERRIRLAEHKRRIMQGEEWPGFDVPPVGSESLWDNEYNPLAAKWSAGLDTPSNLQDNTSLWSTLTNSANSSWNSLMSFTSGWGSQQPSTTSAETTPTESATVPPRTQQEINSGQAFNPFNTMSDIWGPNATTNSTGWNVPRPDNQ